MENRSSTAAQKSVLAPEYVFRLPPFLRSPKTQEKEANFSCSNARRASCRCWLRIIFLQLYLASVSASIENCFFEGSFWNNLHSHKLKISIACPSTMFFLAAFGVADAEKLGQICNERRVGGTHTQRRAKRKTGKKLNGNQSMMMMIVRLINDVLSSAHFSSAK